MKLEMGWEICNLSQWKCCVC